MYQFYIYLLYNLKIKRESNNDSLSTFSSSKSHNINNGINVQKEIFTYNNFSNSNEKYLNINNENLRLSFNDNTKNIHNLYQTDDFGHNYLNNNLIGNKKGRPMNDKNLIYDEITNKVYDPAIDLIEYKKARK